MRSAKAAAAPAPGTIDPLLAVSGVELARRIRTREVTSRAVVEAHIARVESVNPTINAVVARRYDQARAEADAADARIVAALARAAAGDASAVSSLPPYLGVPCTIKECFALTGMPQSSGLVARKDIVAAEDAVTVARLRAAGAIPLGVTNVSELCMWYETNNRVYGRTNNPYDATRIVGGSSGGEGAIIGAGGSPFGLGSDVGGSIRMPAFFNGVFGHKPTGGLVPGSGQYPAAHGESTRIVATGPLCRRAEDLWPLLQILAGPDGVDEGATAMTLGDPAAVRLDRLTVVDVEDNGLNPVHPELKAAQERVAEVLAQAGARIRRVRFASLRHSFDIWSSTLAAADGQSFSVLLGNGRRTRGALELLKWAVRRSPHTLPAIGLAMLERVNNWAPGRGARYVELGRTLRAEILDAIGDDGVLLYPSYVSPAPRHYKPLWPPFNFVYTAIVNVMKLPATQVPLGLGSEGLPLGVQIVAGPARDHLSIAVALELERAFGGWVPPLRNV
jgi:fatty acid amide hydrolase 2